jgi:hypothetical protein
VACRRRGQKPGAKIFHRHDDDDNPHTVCVVNATAVSHCRQRKGKTCLFVYFFEGKRKQLGGSAEKDVFFIRIDVFIFPDAVVN